MKTRIVLSAALVISAALAGGAQEAPSATPIELEVLKASIGVWDAEIEVWMEGLDSPPITFNGVETNRPYGDYWFASDFDSEVMGQTLKVHSIVGYDLDRRKLVGTIVDHGPYAATMIGEYDSEAKAVRWKTNAKMPDGSPMVQRTTVTHTSADERVLVLTVPSGEEGEFVKFMQITFVKRQ